MDKENKKANRRLRAEDAIKYYEANGTPIGEIQVESFTCMRCPNAETCRCAFDSYSISGDCLMDK